MTHPEYLNYSILRLLNIPTLPHTFLPMKISIKAQARAFPSFFLPPDRLWDSPYVPVWYGVPPSLGNCE